VTPYDEVVVGMAEVFGISVAVLSTSPKLPALVAEALEMVPAAEVVACLSADRPPPANVRNRGGFAVARLRQVVEHLRDQTRLAAEAATEHRACAEVGRHRRVAVLAQLVATGDLPLDAAERELSHALGADLFDVGEAVDELRRYMHAIEVSG
jgi:hypothetical protein